MTSHERRNPRFVTARAAIGGAKLQPYRDWPGGDMPDLAGLEFERVTVVCTFEDLEEVRFRQWLALLERARPANADLEFRIEIV